MTVPTKAPYAVCSTNKPQQRVSPGRAWTPERWCRSTLPATSPSSASMQVSLPPGKLARLLTHPHFPCYLMTQSGSRPQQQGEMLLL